MADADKLNLIASVAANYLRRNSVGIDQIGNVVSTVTRAIEQAAREIDGAPIALPPAAIPVETQAPAVSVKKSIQREHIICLDCGIRARTLKRHLQSAHGLTPQQYRDKWQLAKDYPMVAPAYSEQRSHMAKELGLGRQASGPKEEEAPKRRSRS